MGPPMARPRALFAPPTDTLLGRGGSKLTHFRSLFRPMVALILCLGSLVAWSAASGGQVASAATVAPGKCGSALLLASAWMNGLGVDVMSNGGGKGGDEGTGASCAPRATETIKGIVIPKGYEWQCTELINRLYLQMGWIHQLWKGNGGDSAATKKDSMFYSIPKGLGSEAEGSISHLAPGDAVFINEYRGKQFLADGHALIVDTAGNVTSGLVPLVSQNSGTPSGADPRNAITPVLTGGNLIFTSPKGDTFTYKTIGVVHAPPGPQDLAPTSSLASDGSGYCAVLGSGGVECWGYGSVGELGDGKYYESGSESSAIPVQVVRVGGNGYLGGVAHVISSDSGTYCALLKSGGVDCWGAGEYGNLGNGIFYASGNNYGSDLPVVVTTPSGSGALNGVVSLVSHAGPGGGYCALLKSGEVDCWGYGAEGELGNGTYYSSGQQGSAIPVHVEGLNGAGILGGVRELASQKDAYCAALGSGRVECWGNGAYGELGDGTGTSSAFPTQVVGVGDTGNLTGVKDIVSEGPVGNGGFCSLLSSGGVDCWGDDNFGALGNGRSPESDSDSPVRVVGPSGRGTLTQVTAMASDGGGYCALIRTGGTDCWGDGSSGQLGNGRFSSSSVPIRVEGTNHSGLLGGVARIVGDYGVADGGYCAGLTSGAVDCWGYGVDGELGAGKFYPAFSAPDKEGSAFPVKVDGIGGSGILTKVLVVASDNTETGSISGDGFCAVLSTGGVDCWGLGLDGLLGNGLLYTNASHGGSAIPVRA